MRSVELHPLAAEEMRDAAVHYDSARRGLGRELLDEIRRSLDFLRRFPEAAPFARGVVRKLVISRFPYSILYRVIDTDRIRVVAIAHHKRRPGYWSGRE